MTKANQERFLIAIGTVLATIEQEAYDRGMADGKRGRGAVSKAVEAEKDAVISKLRVQRQQLRDAMILIREHVAVNGTDRGDSAVDAIAWAALQATPVDPGVNGKADLSGRRQL